MIGTTGNLVKKTEFLIKKMQKYRNIKFFLPKNLYRTFKNKSNIFEFNFTKTQFKNIDFAICRPGLGSIQELLYFKIPFFLLDTTDENNFELKHNEKKLISLGLTKKFSIKYLNNIVKFQKDLNFLKKNFKKEIFDGSNQAAIIIKKKI